MSVKKYSTSDPFPSERVAANLKRSCVLLESKHVWCSDVSDGNRTCQWLPRNEQAGLAHSSQRHRREAGTCSCYLKRGSQATGTIREVFSSSTLLSSCERHQNAVCSPADSCGCLNGTKALKAVLPCLVPSSFVSAAGFSHWYRRTALLLLS